MIIIITCDIYIYIYIYIIYTHICVCRLVGKKQVAPDGEVAVREEVQAGAAGAQEAQAPRHYHYHYYYYCYYHCYYFVLIIIVSIIIIYIYIYIYIHIHICNTYIHRCINAAWSMWGFDYNFTNYNFKKDLSFKKKIWTSSLDKAAFGWHYLSNATRLMRPRLFYACFVVSRTTTICYIIRHFWRKTVLDK